MVVSTIPRGASQQPAASYLTIVEQLEKGMVIPDNQRENVYALVRIEQSYKGKEELLPSFYSQEELDKAVYFLIAEGRCVLSNNIRAVSNEVRSLVTRNPKQTLLVHRAGSPLDFNLTQNLLTSEYNHPSLYVERKGNRCNSRIGVSILEDTLDNTPDFLFRPALIYE